MLQGGWVEFAWQLSVSRVFVFVFVCVFVFVIVVADVILIGNVGNVARRLG